MTRFPWTNPSSLKSEKWTPAAVYREVKARLVAEGVPLTPKNFMLVERFADLAYQDILTRRMLANGAFQIGATSVFKISRDASGVMAKIWETLMADVPESVEPAEDEDDFKLD